LLRSRKGRKIMADPITAAMVGAGISGGTSLLQGKSLGKSLENAAIGGALGGAGGALGGAGEVVHTGGGIGGHQCKVLLRV
jgi:hypothetical protein